MPATRCSALTRSSAPHCECSKTAVLLHRPVLLKQLHMWAAAVAVAAIAITTSEAGKHS